MKKIVTIISLILCLFLFRGMSYGQNIDIDSDDNSKVDGAAEAVGAGWDSDVDAPQKKDLYDYLVGIDADLDGDIGDGIVTLSANWVNTANPWAVNEGGTGAATFTDGGLLVGATASAFEALAVGLTTQVLVGGGAATNPAWGTDLPTAVTIGTAYIYRVGGTDVSDADVVDTLTITNISQVQDITASAAEINILDNVTGVTAAELSYIGDVTSAIQVQLDAKLTALTNEAGLYSELSDVTRFFEINDNDPTWGTSDTDDATVTVYGDGAGNGGKIDLYNSASEDGTDEYWRIEANGESLNVGPTNALTAFVFNRDGSINKSATPKLTLDDTDGADGYIDLNATDADDATMTIGVDDSVGDDTPYITLNGTTEIIALSKPVTAPGIDAGRGYTNVEANNQTVQIGDSVCSHQWYITDATGEPDTITFEFPPSPECTTGYAKMFCFMFRGTTASAAAITFDPDTSDNADKIILPFDSSNSGAASGAGITVNLATPAKGEEVCFKGRTDGGVDYWQVTNVVGDAPVE